MRPGERGRGLLCAAHVANWLVSCHLVFLQIGKLSFSAGALEPLSLLSRLPQIEIFCDGEMTERSGLSFIFLPESLFSVQPDVPRGEC